MRHAPPGHAPQDSNETGAGYETALKGEGGVAAKRAAPKAGTTRVKKAAAKANAGGNPLAGLFGNK